MLNFEQILLVSLVYFEHNTRGAFSRAANSKKTRNWLSPFLLGQYLARAMGDPQPPTDQILSSEKRKNLDYSAVGIFSTAFWPSQWKKCGAQTVNENFKKWCHTACDQRDKFLWKTSLGWLLSSRGWDLSSFFEMMRQETDRHKKTFYVTVGKS